MPISHQHHNLFMEKDIFDALAQNAISEILFSKKPVTKSGSLPSFPSFSSIDSLPSKDDGEKPQLSAHIRNMRCADAAHFLAQKAPLIVKDIEHRLGFQPFKAEPAFLAAKQHQELQQEKSRVKRELSLYDEEFKRDVARLPAEKEKAPMRAFYLYYKRLKQALDRAQATGVPAETQKARVEVLRRLEELQLRKKALNQALFAFQKNFEVSLGRSIKYTKDLLPVESEYREYKAVKADIAVLKSWLEKDG